MFGIIVIPILYLNKTIDPVITIRLLFLSFILFSLNIIVLWKWKSYKTYTGYFNNFLVFSFLCYAIISAISLINAINISEALYDLSKIIVSGILLFFSILILAYKRENITVLCKSVVVSSLIVSGIGLGQYFFNIFYSIPGAMGVYSTMTNRNLFFFDQFSKFTIYPICLFYQFQ